ncbi:MAG: basic amino acid ABC transporter substrate-binding protein [Firmicutes bacterium]|nr:basic amino acid ABC transporter substrate-binding protein [Bacillota bacterium]
MKKTGILIILLAVMLFATACGGAKDDKVLKVGTEPTFPPFEFTDEVTGKIDGFDIALISAIAEKAGYEVEITSVAFDGLIAALQSGNIDVVASGMSITPEREESVNFSDPYIDAGLTIAVTEKNSSINSEADLQGKVVGVQIGTTGAEKANELKDAGIVKSVKTYNTIDVAFLDLLNGAIDCVINDGPVNEAYMSKNVGKIKIVGDVLVSDQYGFAIAKGNDSLIADLNKALKELVEDGTYDTLVAKYFGK